MTDLTFTIDTIDSSKQVTGSGTVTLTGFPARVRFDNKSGEAVNVYVIGVGGTRPGLNPNPASGSLFGHGRMILDVPQNPPPPEQLPLAVNPNQGVYQLTTDRSGASATHGTITVKEITFTIDSTGNFQNNREGFNVSLSQLRGTASSLRVSFVNNFHDRRTVYVSAAPGHPEAGALFRSGPGTDPLVTLRSDGVEMLTVEPGSTATAVISDTAAVHQFTLSTVYPVNPGGCPTVWINHQC
jgi:hypothetical protein